MAKTGLTIGCVCVSLVVLLVVVSIVMRPALLEMNRSDRGVRGKEPATNPRP